MLPLHKRHLTFFPYSEPSKTIYFILLKVSVIEKLFSFCSNRDLFCFVFLLSWSIVSSVILAILIIISIRIITVKVGSISYPMIILVISIVITISIISSKWILVWGEIFSVTRINFTISFINIVVIYLITNIISSQVIMSWIIVIVGVLISTTISMCNLKRLLVRILFIEM